MRRLDRADSDIHLDSGGAQCRVTASRHPRVGVFDRAHDTHDARRDQRVDTRRGLSVVRARFERREHGRAARTFARFT